MISSDFLLASSTRLRSVGYLIYAGAHVASMLRVPAFAICSWLLELPFESGKVLLSSF